jgi:outer membrane protein
VPDEPWSYSGTLSANVEVFGGGRRFHELGQAKADLRAAEAGVTGDDYGLRLSVKQAFFNVLAARESERAAAAQLEQAEQQLHTVLARVRNKVATRSDSLRSEIQARNAHLAVLDAANSLNVAGASLTRAVGTPYPITAVRDDVAAETVDLDDSALAARAAQGPALRAARARLDAARAARRISWTGYLPSVNASYSRSASGTDEAFGLGADDYNYSGSLRLSLSFPLFNQLQREEQVVRAQVAVDNAEAALRDAELATRLDITQATGSYRVNLERVAALSASVEAAEEDLRVQQQRYSVGGSTLLDVLTSQTQLNQARQDLIRARYDLRVAKAQIEAIIGEDL